MTDTRESIYIKKEILLCIIWRINNVVINNRFFIAKFLIMLDCSYVTHFAIYVQKFKCMLLAKVVTVLKRHTYVTSSLAKLKWSTFLECWFVTLYIYDGDIGACGVHQLAAIEQKVFPWPVWNLLSLVVWLRPCDDNLWCCTSSKQYLGDLLPPPTPHPILPFSSPTQVEEYK